MPTENLVPSLNPRWKVRVSWLQIRARRTTPASTYCQGRVPSSALKPTPPTANTTQLSLKRRWRSSMLVLQTHTRTWRKITALEGSRRRGPLGFHGETSRRRTSSPYLACSSTAGRAHGRIEVLESDAPLDAAVVRFAATVNTACKPGPASLRGEQDSFRPMYCFPPAFGTFGSGVRHWFEKYEHYMICSRSRQAKDKFKAWPFHCSAFPAHT